MSKIKQSRRTILRKSVGAITGIGMGVVVGTVGTALAALPHALTVSGGGDLYYEIHVNSDITPSDIDDSDEDRGSYCTGSIGYSTDDWNFSGDVTEIVLEGAGDCAFYINAAYDPAYKVDIFTDGTDRVDYNWDQEGDISERNGTVDPNDRITKENDGTYSAHGSVGSGTDQFYPDGYPYYVSVTDSPQDVSIGVRSTFDH